MKPENRFFKLVITEYTPEHQQIPYLLTGLFYGSQMLEVHCEKKEAPSILGNIYIGRVQKIAKNLNAAFIEYEKGRNGYYPLEQLHQPIYVKKIKHPSLVQGDELLVQVAKDPVKTKLPVLSTNLNFSGTYCVLTSENRKVGISAKIPSPRREELQQLFAEQLKPDTTEWGVILRTNAKDADNETILDEYKQLSASFQKLKEEAAYRICFSCLKQSEPDYLKRIRNSYLSNLSEIVTDLPDVYRKIRDTMSPLLDRQKIICTYYEDASYPLLSAYNIRKQMERALNRLVWLKSGGYLVIEPTEALTVIDVNTGKSIIKKQPQEHFMRLNLEAAEEIARQLRLRNISGIIIIDFINLKTKEEQKRLLQELKRLTANDPIPVQVVDMTSLHLVELTRKKISKSLKEQLT